MQFYHFIQGALQPGTMSLDQVFNWNIRFQVFVQNQEEKHLIDAYQLMYGREVESHIWSEWEAKCGPQWVEIGGTSFLRAGESILPMAFATFNDVDLRAHA